MEIEIGFFIVFIVLLIMIVGNLSANNKQGKWKSQLNIEKPIISTLENNIKEQLIELELWVNTCRKCNHNEFYIFELTEVKMVYKCKDCGARNTINYDNTFYAIEPINQIHNLFTEITDFLLTRDYPSKYANYLIDPAFVKETKPVYEFINDLSFRYIIFKQTKKQISWSKNVSCLEFGCDGRELDRVIYELQTKKIGNLSPNRKELSAKIIEDWNYRKITTGTKGQLIKNWAKKSQLECIDGSKCGGVKFSSLDNSDITFGHIIPQSWGKEYPHMIKTIHHPDNLYLTCKSCNSSLNSNFPDTVLKKKISGKEGTIGDWLRTHITEIEPSE